MKQIAFLDTKEVINLHDMLIKKYGGLPGIHDKKLLESAIAQPQITIFGKYACKNIFEMAAAYCYHITKNHPFLDGNKRIALLTSLTFLEKNNVGIKSDANFYTFMLDVASSKISKEEIAEFFKEHTIQ